MQRGEMARGLSREEDSMQVWEYLHQGVMWRKEEETQGLERLSPGRREFQLRQKLWNPSLALQKEK